MDEAGINTVQQDSIEVLFNLLSSKDVHGAESSTES